MTKKFKMQVARIRKHIINSLKYDFPASDLMCFNLPIISFKVFPFETFIDRIEMICCRITEAKRDYLTAFNFGETVLDVLFANKFVLIEIQYAK